MILSLLLLPTVISICPDTITCINRVREVVAGPKRFWFGEQRRAQCHHRRANPIDCFGPSHLSSFHSLGSRLFRARTYHSAYLRNLQIIPRVTYRAAGGSYRACEHNFHVSNGSVPVEADPDMTPVAPFQIRHRPEIGWQGLQFDDSFTVLMTDVGFGTLNYLIEDFPRNTTVLKDYEPSDNFRSSANPLVILVFKKGAVPIEKMDREEFSLPEFMVKHQLEDNLIGLNLVVVSVDSFAIERQRLRGNVDNCHSLLAQKLSNAALSTLFSSLALSDLSQWISVSFDSPRLNVNVCCQKIRQSASRIHLDPLGDLSISALSTLQNPSFSSLRIPTNGNNYLNYHRQARTYIALSDSMFSLCVVDASSGRLHWLVVDIPTAELATENTKGIEKALYHPLLSPQPASCRRFIFLLFEQSHSIKNIEKFCDGDCTQRNQFRFDLFAQKFGLRLSAVNWVSSCYDLQYAFHTLSRSQNTTTLQHVDDKGKRRPLVSTRLASSEYSQICSAFKVSPHHRLASSSQDSSFGLSRAGNVEKKQTQPHGGC